MGEIKITITLSKKMEKQVNKSIYEFKKYCDLDRWNSYWHQIDEILKLKPFNVLEIGIGDSVSANYIKNNTQIKYHTLDIDPELNPDIVGNIEHIPVNNNSYDLVCAFEVLEHLPFERFKASLEELKKTSKKYVIISLPHWGRHFSIDIRFPCIKSLKWKYKLNLFPIKHKFNGQHYWEIGKKEFPLKKIKKEIKKAGFFIIKDYIVFESPYHHFFILKK